MSAATSPPARPGTYVLALRLEAERVLTVGRLGTFAFAPGLYLYVGSAWGPGGLRARLARHWRGPQRLRWHVDYVRHVAPVAWAAWVAGERLECRWSQALAASPALSVPVLGFGASDCRRGCRAHLLVGGLELSPSELLPYLAEAGREQVALLVAPPADDVGP